MSFPGSVLLTRSDIFKESTTKVLPLGTRGYTRDGRSFRYARAGGTISQAGLVLQAAAPAATKDSVFTTAGFASGTTYVSTGMTAYKMYGSSSKAFRSSNGGFVDGYFYLNDSTGSTLSGGQNIHIKSHTWATSTLVAITINPFEGEILWRNATTKAQITVQRNMYDRVIEAPKAATNSPVGVAPRGVTSLSYFWVQTWGPCVTNTVGTVVIGQPVHTADGTDTANVGPYTTGVSTGTRVDNPVVGNVLHVGATLNSSLIDLHLAP